MPFYFLGRATLRPFSDPGPEEVKSTECPTKKFICLMFLSYLKIICVSNRIQVEENPAFGMSTLKFGSVYQSFC